MKVAERTPFSVALRRRHDEGHDSLERFGHVALADQSGVRVKSSYEVCALVSALTLTVQTGRRK